MNIVWSELAVSHLQAAFDYIADDDLPAGERVLASILFAVERLKKFPDLGRIGRVPKTRELVIPGTPFIEAYRASKERVEVLAIVHTSRKWPTHLEPHR